VPQESSADAQGITVVATGTASAPPDVLRLDLGAEALGQNPQIALTEAGQALERMRTELSNAGVAAADLTSGTISLWPQHEDKGKISGYSATLRMSARIRDLDQAGALISRVVGAGGEPARLDGLTFEHSQPAGLLATAREAGWRDAEAAGRQYAALAGRELGPVLAVIETPVDGPVQPVFRAAMATLAEAVPIEPGVSAVTVRVQVRYAFAGARDSDP
jgi:uncharacterized protein YggE